MIKTLLILGLISGFGLMFLGVIALIITTLIASKLK